MQDEGVIWGASWLSHRNNSKFDGSSLIQMIHKQRSAKIQACAQCVITPLADNPDVQDDQIGNTDHGRHLLYMKKQRRQDWIYKLTLEINGPKY